MMIWFTSISTIDIFGHQLRSWLYLALYPLILSVMEMGSVIDTIIVFMWHHLQKTCVISFKYQANVNISFYSSHMQLLETSTKI